MLNKKYAFSLIEIIVLILIVSIVTVSLRYKFTNTDLFDAKNRLLLYLNYTRYIAFLDNKFDSNDLDYQKKYWTLKFQHCSKTIGGLYFVVYSDSDTSTTHFKKSDCLKDPLSNKYLYSNWDCEASSDESKYILLTKQYGVQKVELSCNTTSTIGQISFSNIGKIYSNLSSTPTEIKKRCYLKLYDKDNNMAQITIEPNTGYSY